ncbi:hypothetical protein BDB00DRAFT_879254 [Zychaea mexicana]|uniref:uncharacterized protein n=1 Tax=Zychaea mexicana TaxID=64656 RepID=UPI0022FF128A|nr:uncharacterized protein BDB00DRAFT_879254 [Zychaea mexicana]KAI9479610.1 hypothetical protein BDB00DRAFT_879254 [Zychaea mexicana]
MDVSADVIPSQHFAMCLGVSSAGAPMMALQAMGGRMGAHRPGVACMCYSGEGSEFISSGSVISWCHSLKTQPRIPSLAWVEHLDQSEQEEHTKKPTSKHRISTYLQHTSSMGKQQTK